jgi:hypothetical protein
MTQCEQVANKAICEALELLEHGNTKEATAVLQNAWVYLAYELKEHQAQ